MPLYLTCEADLDFPVPNVTRVLARLRTLADGTTPVTTRSIALAVGADVLAIEGVLRRAHHSGLVRRVAGRGWVPLEH